MSKRLHVWRTALVIALAAALGLPGGALARDPATDRAERLEQRLGGVPANLVLIGFSDRETGEGADCSGGVDQALPCIERVTYAFPEGLDEARPGYAQPLDAEEQAAAGKLLFWSLGDVAFRTNKPIGPTTASVDAGLWDRGATRLPTPDTIWRSQGLAYNGRLQAVTVPDAQLWASAHIGSEALCQPLDYAGGVGTPASRPAVRVCVDGFVSNFANVLNQPIDGQLFRHGKVEHAGGSGVGASASGNEMLLTEYLFVSGLRDSPPWSNSYDIYGREQGVFRDVPVVGGNERLVVPPALADPAEQPGPDWDPRVAADWQQKWHPDLLYRYLTAGTARFAFEIGSRILGNSTIEYNPTHVRSIMALTAMLKPPTAAGARPREAASGGRNPGHRYANRLGLQDDDGDGKDEGGPHEAAGGSAIIGQVGVQIRKLPPDLRWKWISWLLPDAVDVGQLPRIVESCAACPGVDAVPGETEQQRLERTRWAEAVEAARSGAEDLPQRLAAARYSFEGALEDRISQQLLGALLSSLGVDRGALLFDHLVTEMSVVLNSMSAWDPAELEAQGTSTWETVLQSHGYPTIPLKLGGAPANPLAVCEGRGDDAQSFKLVTVSALFEADARAEGGKVEGRDAWDLVLSARDQLAFVAVDAPEWTPLEVEPVFVLPSGRTIYRARWQVWSGWHIFWGLHDLQMRDGENLRDIDGVVLRSGAICDDTILVPEALEPSVMRASLLRNFEPTTAWDQADESPPSEVTNDDAYDAGEAAADKASDGLSGAADMASGGVDAGIEAAKNGDLGSLFGPGRGRTIVARTDTPAAELRSMLLRKLRNHRRLSCSRLHQVGTLTDDADGDGYSERDGDCDDGDPEFQTSRAPTLLTVIDLAHRTIREGQPNARTPYLRLPGRPVSGAVFSLSLERSWEPDATTRHVTPDARAVARLDRWGRRSSPEFNLALGFGWSPLAPVWMKCDPDYSGAPSVTCPRDSQGELRNTDATLDPSGNVLSWSAQFLVANWDSNYHRAAFEGGLEVGLALQLAGVWQQSSSQRRINLFRPSTAILVGARWLPLPVFRTPAVFHPWGDQRRVGTARFPRGQVGVRGGWALTAGFGGMEGGPVLEGWWGGAVRRRAGANASLTPYRPRGILGGFVRGDLLVPLLPGGNRVTRLHVAASLTFGFRGNFGLGMREVKEPDLPDADSFKLPDKPTLPGALGGG